MATTLTAQVELSEKVHFVGQTGGAHSVDIDYPPPLGDGDGFTGLQMLLLSLAGCSAQTVVNLLRRMNQPVQGMEVKAVGRRRDEHPTVLTKIELEFTVHGIGIDSQAVARAIALSEEQFCPVWAMLKAGTSITSSYRIVD
jgi:putative redox protein